MSAPYRIHLLGFSTFERSALASYLRLAASRSPAYALADGLGDAHFLVVDADDAAALRASHGRVAQAVYVGAEAPAGAGAWMMRPIDPLHVLRTLDTLAGSRPPLQSAYGTARTTLPDGPPAQRRRWMPARRATDGPAGGDGFVALPGPRPASALLVLREPAAVEQPLRALGVETWQVPTPEQAMGLLERQPFDFVFVDALPDGLALCHHAKRLLVPAAGQHGPVVALVGEAPSELERARATFAGCDAWLAPPLEADALRQLVAPLSATPAPSPDSPAATPR